MSSRRSGHLHNSRRNVGRFSSIAIVTVLLAALFAAGSASASSSDEANFVASVNSIRANAGLPPLKTDGQLAGLGRNWAGRMRDGVCGAGNNICHASPISAGVTHSWTKLGENVGTGPNVSSIMQAFAASPSHYSNIVDPSFTHIGVGVVWDGPRMYTTHRFMAAAGAAPTTAAPTTTVPPTTAAPTTTVPPTTAAPTTTAAPRPSGEPTPTTAQTAPVVSTVPTPEPKQAVQDAPSPTASRDNDRAPVEARGVKPIPSRESPPAVPTTGADTTKPAVTPQRVQALVEALATQITR